MPALSVLQPILLLWQLTLSSQKRSRKDAAFTVVAIIGAVFLVLVGTNTGTSDIKGDLSS